jgi:hypothetical protein
MWDRMTIAYSVFADGLSQTPVFASPLDRGRLFFINLNASSYKGNPIVLSEDELKDVLERAL